MLILPAGNEPFRILAIDPGTNTLGTAVIDVDLVTNTYSIQHARTFKGNSMMRRFGNLIDVHGEREAKIRAHRENILEMLLSYYPTVVICEAPFIGRFKVSGLALTECLSGLREAVSVYDPSLPLETVEPQAAKAAVGASFRGSTKDDVKKGVLAHTGLLNPHNLDIQGLDEHSIDAIAIGIYKTQSVCEALRSPKI